jgi:hypothetical protein
MLFIPSCTDNAYANIRSVESTKGDSTLCGLTITKEDEYYDVFISMSVSRNY